MTAETPTLGEHFILTVSLLILYYGTAFMVGVLIWWIWTAIGELRK